MIKPLYTVESKCTLITIEVPFVVGEFEGIGVVQLSVFDDNGSLGHEVEPMDYEYLHYMGVKVDYPKWEKAVNFHQDVLGINIRSNINEYLRSVITDEVALQIINDQKITHNVI